MAMIRIFRELDFSRAVRRPPIVLASSIKSGGEKTMQLLPPPSLLDEQQVSDSGLTSSEAEERLARFGFNEPANGKQRGVLSGVVALFANPLVLILLIAAIISAYLGEVTNAAIVAGIVFVGGGVNLAQTFRSQRSWSGCGTASLRWRASFATANGADYRAARNCAR